MPDKVAYRVRFLPYRRLDPVEERGEMVGRRLDQVAARKYVTEHCHEHRSAPWER